MTCETKPMTDAWLRRALTVALWFAYTPALLFTPAAVLHGFGAVREQGELWGLALYAMGSCVGVSLALITVTVLTRWVSTTKQKRLFLFLLVNWLPHIVIVWFCSFLQLVGTPGAWID